MSSASLSEENGLREGIAAEIPLQRIATADDIAQPLFFW